MGSRRVGWLSAAAMALACGAWAAPASAYPFGSTVQPLGAETTIPRCANTAPPDLPVRAYRDLGGTVHLTMARAATTNPTPENPAPPDENRRLSGPDLVSVAPLSCQAVLSHGGSANSDFSTYHWGEWLAAPYRLPGSNTVHALVHTEFHGADFNRPDLCTYGSSQPALGLSWCWLSATTSAVSSDGGANFEHAQTPPAHLVANIPYQYEKDSGATGFRAPTNIVRRSEPGGDFYYTMFDASQFSQGSFAAENMQQSGACIMRTTDVSSPSSWRAWDGNSADDTQGGFTVQFQYPFPIEPVAGGLCTPLDETRPVPLSNSLVSRGLSFNSYFDRYMLVGNRTTTEPDGTTFFYVYYLLSDDLVHWSAPNLIMRAPTIAQYRADGCSGPDVPIVYPTVMDRDDPSTNFERTSQTADLYYLRRGDINPNGCTNNFPGLNHQLTRVPIRLGSAREATGRPFGCSGSFDSSTRRSGASSFVSQQGSSYSGDPRSYAATVHAAGTAAYGLFERDGEPPDQCEQPEAATRPRFGFGDSDEVTYSAAFAFPSDGFWRQLEHEADRFPSVALMRLEDPESGDWAGMLTIDKQRRLRFSTSGSDPATKKQLLGNNGVQLARDECWHFLEVHQKVSSDPAKALNEIWVDGVRRDVPLADDANHYGNGTYDKLKVGITSKANVRRPLTLFTDSAAFGYSALRSPAYDPALCDAPG